MNRALPLVLLALGAGAAGFFLYLGLAGQDRPADDGLPALPSAPQTAEFAPAFVLPDLDGTPRSSGEWDESIRIVNFWATWCPPCIREIPLLVDIQAEYAARGVQVIGIAIDEPDAVAEFAANFAFNYPVLIGQDDAMDLGNQFLAGFIGLPFTAFTDRSGRIVRVHTGELHREQLEEILAGLL
ncbi:MAG: TlpA family protein disulfide reductase [Gammaproteobacteria bacterium]